MITPEKHLDLDLSVLRAGAVMLKVPKKDRWVELPTMREKLVKRLGVDAELIFMSAMNFLFLIGRMEYHSKNDSLEYVHETPRSAREAKKDAK